MRVKNHLVRIFDDYVEKYTDEPKIIAEKYRAIQRIASVHGFVAPKVVDVGRDKIVLERIHGIESLRNVYLSGDLLVANNAFFGAGVALARIHQCLAGFTGVEWRPSVQFQRDLMVYSGKKINLESLRVSLLHGDYSFANVFLKTDETKQLVIIDPCPNFASTMECWQLGPVYLDIGKMMSCMEGQVPISSQFFVPSRNRISELQKIFVAGYESVAEPIDVEVAMSFGFATVSAQFERRFGALGKARTMFLYNRIRGNFPISIKR